MNHERPWTGRLESWAGGVGRKRIMGAVLWEESRDLSFLLMRLFPSAQQVHRSLPLTCGHNPWHE